MPVDGAAVSAPNSIVDTVKALAADIKVAHSIFALPFALFACFLVRDAAASWLTFGVQLLLVIACMVMARTAAMLANRILDRQIDATNPRTNKRPLASGKVALRDAVVVLIYAAVGFVVLTGVFGFAFNNWWPLLLALPVLGWVCAYPLFKRFTAACHLYLGASLALSPLAAALAINPEALGETATLYYLAALVLTWVAGFDVIYALQDLDCDREAGLNSIPANLGYAKALWVSRLLHGCSVGALVAVYFSDVRLQTVWFQGAIAAVVLLLLIEHIVTAKDGLGKIQLTFFMLNGIISCVLGGVGILSILLSAS